MTRFYLLRLIFGKCNIFQNLKVKNKKSRQLLDFADDPKLAKKLDMKPGEYRSYEIFVTQLCHGSICDVNFNPTMDQIKSVIDQVIAGLEQLSAAGKIHNDLKPTNLLYLQKFVGKSVVSHFDCEYIVKVSDFGQAGKRGGTPGWTAPVFHRERQSGKEDIYSIGWILLRLLCESKYLFLSLRDNYVENVNESWMIRFRSMIEIDFVFKLVDLNSPPTVQQVKDHWKRIRSSVRMIDLSRLQEIGVPTNSLGLQLERPW